MAKGKSTQTAPVKSGDNRPNGKAFKKKPGPAQPVKSIKSIGGRVLKNHALREAWKASGGTATHTSIPHWKTGKVYKKRESNVPNVA
jgi:hypothetical protein